MKHTFIYTSLTRITNLSEINFSVESLPRDHWANGDYVIMEITHTGSGARIESSNGRMIDPLPGEYLIGALGVRAATLEATGSWEVIQEDGKLHLLTGAGLIGKLTSRSVFSPNPIQGVYKGHVTLGGEKYTMQKAAPPYSPRAFDTPVVLLVGTSMSAGKTTTGRLVTHQLSSLGLTVLGAKLTGAGRYRDILAFKDSGAESILDFVDVGLPSSICPPAEYSRALDQLIYRMGAAQADVAVVEIGASPLEPYNGDIAIERIQENIRCKILCASDPYAVLGIMHSYDFRPELVSGPATNTLAAIELVKKLCGVQAVNLMQPENLPILSNLLKDKLGIE